MANSVRVCGLNDLTPGEGLRIAALTPPIAVFLTESGEVFAVDDTCTHQEASLADGWVEECWVECPLHDSRFDLRTGSVEEPPAKRPVRAHLVTIVGNDVSVEVSEAEPNLPPGVTYGLR